MNDLSQDAAPARAIPGDAGPPFIGNSLRQLRDPLGLAREYHARYGPVFWTRVFGIRGVLLVGPEANQLVLRNADSAFSSGLGWEFYIAKFFPRGLMLLDFDEHRHHRGIMQAAFRKAALAEYLARMTPAIERGVAAWGAAPDCRVLPRAKQLTLDLATAVFMGQQLGPEADRVNRAFVDCVRAGTAVLRFALPGGRWHKGLAGRRLLEAFFRTHLPAHRAGHGQDLFSQLCRAEDEQGRRFSDDDVVNHMIFLMMAAHDTTTITLCSVLYRLAQHPQWQERLRAEAAGLAAPPTPEDMARLPLADLVIKEAMRLMPPVPGLPRRTVKDVDFMGYRIPRETFVMIDLQLTHRLEPWWTRPEEFDPERFGEGRHEHRRHPFQFVPFGGGAHTCIGMHFAEIQVKAILWQLLRRYRWSTAPGYEMPVDHTSLPVPRDGLPIRLEAAGPSS
jgi:cytochrome P450